MGSKKLDTMPDFASAVTVRLGSTRSRAGGEICAAVYLVYLVPGGQKAQSWQGASPRFYKREISPGNTPLSLDWSRL